jgi:hypothetical protein
MIDPRVVASGAAWVAGAAIVLATVSYRWWGLRAAGRAASEYPRELLLTGSLYWGVAVAALGLVIAPARPAWVRALWIAAAAIAVFEALAPSRRPRRQHADPVGREGNGQG